MNFRKIIRKAENYSTDLRLNKDIDIDECLKFYNKVMEWKTDNSYDEEKIRASLEKLEFFLNRLDRKKKLWNKFFEKYDL